MTKEIKRMFVSSHWHLSMGGIYEAARVHLVLEVYVLEAGQMGKQLDDWGKASLSSYPQNCLVFLVCSG